MPPPTGGRTPPGINVKANIRTGMEEQVVLSLIGGPPGDYSTNKDAFIVYDSFMGGIAKKGGPKPRVRSWQTNEGAILVWFGNDGRATRVVHGEVYKPPSLFEKLMKYIESMYR